MKTLDEYYAKHAREIYAYIYSFCYNKELCEEVVQDTFYQAYISIHSLDATNLRAWLYRTAYSKFIDSTRKSKRIQLQEPDFFTNYLIEPNFEGQFIKEEEVKTVFKKINDLPLNQKQALLLSTIHKLSYQEIATILEITESSVKSLIFRARTTLRNNQMEE